MCRSIFPPYIKNRYYGDILRGLYPLFGDSEPDDAVRDNAAGAVARMIMVNPQSIPLNQVSFNFIFLNLWIIIPFVSLLVSWLFYKLIVSCDSPPILLSASVRSFLFFWKFFLLKKTLKNQWLFIIVFPLWFCLQIPRFILFLFLYSYFEHKHQQFSACHHISIMWFWLPFYM